MKKLILFLLFIGSSTFPMLRKELTRQESEAAAGLQELSEILRPIPQQPIISLSSKFEFFECDVPLFPDSLLQVLKHAALLIADYISESSQHAFQGDGVVASYAVAQVRINIQYFHKNNQAMIEIIHPEDVNPLDAVKYLQEEFRPKKIVYRTLLK